jgi:hypothetical protein
MSYIKDAIANTYGPGFVLPITRASFIEAYADEYPYRQCGVATDVWDALHDRELTEHGGHAEIDEDPS